MAYEDQMNLYAYVGNDPVNNVDPSGKFLLQAVGFFVGGYSTYKAAKKAGLSGKSLVAATAVGAGLGALTGGGSGALVVNGIKGAATKALQANAIKTAGTVAGGTVSGAVSGSTGEIVGNMANDQLPTKEGMIDATVNGGFNGAVGGSVATIAGPQVGAVATAVSGMIGNASATEHNSNTTINQNCTDYDTQSKNKGC